MWNRNSAQLVFCAVIAFFGLQFVLSAAQAATATTTFQVQITITNACAIDSASTLDFGSRGSLSLGVSATSTINVQCTLLVPYSIGLDAGTGAGATIATRKMTGPGSATINYSLYQDLIHLFVWGTTILTNTVAGIGTGLSIPYTVYGYVPAQATPAAGVYTDTITVTVTY
jgi:spore coat protein U-like protein